MLKCCLFGFQISPGCKNAKLYAQFWNPVEIFWNYIFQLLKCKVKIDWWSIHILLCHPYLFSPLTEPLLSPFSIHLSSNSLQWNALCICISLPSSFLLFKQCYKCLLSIRTYLLSFFFLFIHPYLFLLFLLVLLPENLRAHLQLSV